MLRRGSFVRRLGDGIPGIVTFVGLRFPEVLWLDRERPEAVEGVGLGVNLLDHLTAYRLSIRASGLAGAVRATA